MSISSFFVALLPERKVRAMLQKTVGIVLHVLKYNDTSNIVEMYTELSGRASFLVTVPRSKKATVKSVLFQPLALIEFEADYRILHFLELRRPNLSVPLLLFPMILLNRLSLFFSLNFFIVPFVRRLRTVRCLPIYNILYYGWIPVRLVLLISIWYF